MTSANSLYLTELPVNASTTSFKEKRGAQHTILSYATNHISIVRHLAVHIDELSSIRKPLAMKTGCLKCRKPEFLSVMFGKTLRQVPKKRYYMLLHL